LLETELKNQSCPEKYEYKTNSDSLRHLKKQLFKARIVSSFIVGLCMLFIMKVVFWRYEGVIVARLPFKPVGIFSNVTHNLLEGEDYSQCSVAFLYLLALLTLRNTIRKLLGINRPRTREPITIGFPARLFSSGEKYNYWWQSPKWIFFFMAGFYGYSLYRLARKHQSIKHKIALSRNLSRLTGFACSLRLPEFLRPIVYGSFGKLYGINFEEMKHSDLKFYESFNKFFTRELKEGVRSITKP